MEVNIRVPNCDEYLDRMKRGLTLQEKLFFVNRINLTQYDYIVDFGGADGAHRLLYNCGGGIISSCKQKLLYHFVLCVA